MPRSAAPFTFAAFAELCRHLRTMTVLRVADLLARDVLPPLPFAVLRLDVDYREAHALRLAEIAAQEGVHGSFYFRWRGGTFPLETMRAVQALGHEVGYHYEALDLCAGDWACARRVFLEHVARWRAAGIRLRTVAAHGSAPRATTYRNNRDLLQRAPELLTQADLLGDAMEQVDFARMWYVSDAGWRWRVYADYTPRALGAPTSLSAWLGARLERERGLYVNVHPHQWFGGAWRARYFRTRNRIGHVLRGKLGSGRLHAHISSEQFPPNVTSDARIVSFGTAIHTGIGTPQRRITRSASGAGTDQRDHGKADGDQHHDRRKGVVAEVNGALRYQHDDRDEHQHKDTTAPHDAFGKTPDQLGDAVSASSVLS